ncbi:MAG: response regulator [Thermodesulfobacteriota bacterium]
MTKTILIIEDDTDILNLIDWHLRDDGYQTLTSGNGSEGLEMAIEQRPDLIILDLMLPGRDGLEVCKTLKRNEATENTHIIMLTAKGEEIDRIVGFELGADDYIVKPFSPRELLLRIRAILRRSTPKGENTALMRHKELVIDPDRYQVQIGNETLQLTLTEFNLLLELVQHKGKVRTRDQLLDRVWGYQFDGYARTVDTHIRRLRQKIAPYSEDIETIRGIGYRFTES